MLLARMSKGEVCKDILRLAIKLGGIAYRREHPGACMEEGWEWAARNLDKYHDEAVETYAIILAAQEERESGHDS